MYQPVERYRAIMTLLLFGSPGFILTNHCLSFSPRFANLNVTQLLISETIQFMVLAYQKYGLANQKSCYIQMHLNVEKSGE